MASYSKVFKATNLSLIEEVKVISQPLLAINAQGEISDTETQQAGDEGIGTQKANQLIQAAKAEAQAIIEMAEQNARSIEAATTDKINQWWEDNQQKLEGLSLEAKQQGFEEGLATGKQEAIQKIQQEYQEKLEQVQHLLNAAYEQKASIISEAEPFLLELSTVIASQIVKRELETNPDHFVELIQQHILRFKEKESITVCVHPDDFDFIQSQRVHLVAVVNGETEIKIIPDHSVSLKGCIIRTAYGSVDARIDTQIEEIKKVILEARREPESGTIS
ncbi:FliH/SctL family protein [Neobacillus vireti]|uniref:Flagellar biosynthesis/type III secretory pathway protein n=1 Tax=Neobacillus vireti LMG 21834 TaxID=1131730 RepID=A0AB94IQM2_9BACI|nr:FliH/SctL family protein [Neobacillus vireti]ETI69344.1 flagellar biosynthesis/type III secretory pathway protein [Neobacillus vireti LMG 21834]